MSCSLIWEGNKHVTDGAAVTLSGATLRFGDRTLWADLTATIRAGEFVAVLGPNGTGKTTLLKVLLGLVPLSSGHVQVMGKPAGSDNRHIGYIPQQKSFDRSLPIRGRDLVALGLNGTQFGFVPGRKGSAELVDDAIEAVHAAAFAGMQIGLLSGGEQQRLRVAQALVGTPDLLLCDEPLLSLDLPSQSLITSLLHDYRSRTGAAIIFVTHEINPILPWVDRVLYIANGKWVIDTPKEVLRSQTLTRLYGSKVEVVDVHGRLLVVGADEAAQAGPGVHHGGEA